MSCFVFVLFCFNDVANVIFNLFLPRLFLSESGPCQLFVFRVPFSQNPALSRCLPVDSSLRKNKLGHRINAEIDQAEEYGLTTVVLMLFQSLISMVCLIVWVCKSCNCVPTRENAEPARHADCRSTPPAVTSDSLPPAKPLSEVLSDYKNFSRLCTSITITLVISHDSYSLV